MFTKRVLEGFIKIKYFEKESAVHKLDLNSKAINCFHRSYKQLPHKLHKVRQC